MTVIDPRTGREFIWKDQPKANTMARWSKKTMYGGEVKGSIRHIAHLDRLNRLARHHYGHGIVVIQSAFNTGVKASAGTHDYDMTADLYIPGVGWWAQQRFFRRNGFGCWYRHAPLFGNHIHGFTLPEHSGAGRANDFHEHGFKVGVYIDGGVSLYGHKVATAQIEDYYNEAFGLSNAHTPHSDRSWFPSDKDATIFDLHAYRQWHARKQAA